MLQCQIKCIDANLPRLIRNTKCSAEFVSILFSKEVISRSEADSLLDTRQTADVRTLNLYNLVQTRSNDSFSKLKYALECTRQTGALEILGAPESHECTRFKIVIVDPKTRLVDWSDSNVQVYRGTFGTRNSLIKLYDRLLPGNLSNGIHEVEMLMRIDWHENIVRCFVAKYVNLCNKHSFAIALGNQIPLYEYYENNQIINMFTKKTFCKQLVAGVTHLHESSIIHLDLRPESIFICNLRQHRPKLKIGEFKMAQFANGPDKDIEASVPELRKKEAAAYLTPEVLSTFSQEQNKTDNIRLGYKTDVFCVGVVLYHLLSNLDHPFGEDFDFMRNIKNNVLLVNEKFLEQLKTTEKNLLLLSLHRSPEERPELNTLAKAVEI